MAIIWSPDGKQVKAPAVDPTKDDTEPTHNTILSQKARRKKKESPPKE